MATFTKFKQTGDRVLYRQDGSARSLRFDARGFVGGTAPETMEVSLPEGSEFLLGGPVPKADMPPEVAQAAETLKAFRAQQKAEKEARMTPEQRAKRDEREAKRAEERAAKAAKKSKTKGKK